MPPVPVLITVAVGLAEGESGENTRFLSPPFYVLEVKHPGCLFVATFFNFRLPPNK